jgi:hypothetical protein
MPSPVQITISYVSVYTNGIATANATAVIPIPPALQNNQIGLDTFDCMLSAISKRGGITFVDANGVTNFIPATQITKITAS